MRPHRARGWIRDGHDRPHRIREDHDPNRHPGSLAKLSPVRAADPAVTHPPPSGFRDSLQTGDHLSALPELGLDTGWPRCLGRGSEARVTPVGVPHAGTAPQVIQVACGPRESSDALCANSVDHRPDRPPPRPTRPARRPSRSRRVTSWTAKAASAAAGLGGNADRGLWASRAARRIDERCLAS